MFPIPLAWRGSVLILQHAHIGRSSTTMIAVVVLLNWVGLDAYSQELPPELRNNRQIQLVANRIGQWNERRINFAPYQDLRERYQQRVARLADERPHGYESREWADQRLQQFQRLADFEGPRLALSEDAASTVLLAAAINIPAMRRMPMEQLEAEIELSTYIIFVDAQRLATAQEQDAIAARHIFSVVFGWWTTVFPLCAASG